MTYISVDEHTEAYRSEASVRMGIDAMQHSTLTSLEAIPLPETPARKGYTKKRPFYRTREDQISSADEA